MSTSQCLIEAPCSKPVDSSTHASSHHPWTPTRRQHRHEPTHWLRHCSKQQLFLFLILTCFFTCTSATLHHIDEEMIERSLDDRTELLASTFARLARSGTILVDPNPPPVPKSWDQQTQNQNPEINMDGSEEATDSDDLRKRATANSNSTSSTSSTSTSSTRSTSTGKSVSSSSTLAPTSTTSGIATAATESPSPLPSPFDTGFNNNITNSCLSFMTSMLSNATFKSCLPFSLLLQNSNSFFQASKSNFRITQTLDYTCAANLSTCSTLLSSFATNLTSTQSCASDLSSGNPTIAAAHLGLLAYRPLYTASCLRNPSTSSYCFADAITNASNPTDSYLYFLPLNVSLVGGSQPTCNRCTQETMGVFEAATSDRSAAISGVYGAAAGQVNVNCGPGFVNASLAAAVTSGVEGRRSAGWNLAVLGVVVGSLLL